MSSDVVPAPKPPPRRGKQAAASAGARLNEAEAIKLRRAGMSFPDIARTLGVSIATAHHYVAAVLERTAQEAPEDREFLRRQALDRLDRAQLGIWDRVEAGSLDAINVWLKLEERRARLYGLDAPARQENVVTAAQPHYEVSLSAREALWAKIQQMAEYRVDRDPVED